MFCSFRLKHNSKLFVFIILKLNGRVVRIYAAAAVLHDTASDEDNLLSLYIRIREEANIGCLQWKHQSHYGEAIYTWNTHCPHYTGWSPCIFIISHRKLFWAILYILLSTLPTSLRLTFPASYTEWLTYSSETSNITSLYAYTLMHFRVYSIYTVSVMPVSLCQHRVNK